MISDAAVEKAKKATMKATTWKGRFKDMSEEQREVFLRQFTIKPSARDWLKNVWFRMAYETSSEFVAEADDTEMNQKELTGVDSTWTQKDSDNLFEDYMENIWLGDGYDDDDTFIMEFADADYDDLDRAKRILNNASFKPQKSKKEKKRKGDRLM